MKTICKKCNRKITPICENHIFNGSEGIVNGSEEVMHGNELIKTGHEKTIYNFRCPFCNTKHKQGKTINE